MKNERNWIRRHRDSESGLINIEPVRKALETNGRDTGSTGQRAWETKRRNERVIVSEDRTKDAVSKGC